jgi:hypothetical protein
MSTDKTISESEFDLALNRTIERTFASLDQNISQQVILEPAGVKESQVSRPERLHYDYEALSEEDAEMVNYDIDCALIPVYLDSWRESKRSDRLYRESKVVLPTHFSSYDIEPGQLLSTSTGNRALEAEYRSSTCAIKPSGTDMWIEALAVQLGTSTSKFFPKPPQNL